MTELSFQLAFRSQEMNSAELPIEVRKPNSRLVARTASSKTVDLQPGRYYVTAVLPGGQEITREADLSSGPLQLTLEPDPEDAWNHEWDEERHFMRGARAQRAPEPAPEILGDLQVVEPLGLKESAPEIFVPKVRAAARPRELNLSLGMTSSSQATFDSSFTLEPTFESPPPPTSLTVSSLKRWDGASPARGTVFIRTFVAGPIGVPPQLVPASTMLGPDQAELRQVAYFKVNNGLQPVLVQLLQDGRVPLNALVAPGSRLSLSDRAASPSDDECGYRLDVLLQSSVANLQLNYARRGEFDLAATATNAEELLRDKIVDPFAAAVGAYSLLRIGATDRLHDWTRNLYEWFPALPDGAAVWGEHLARIGKHSEAETVFSMLPARGLPLFSDGLSYAFERLKVYAGLSDKHRRGVNVERARRGLDVLRPFITFVRPHQPVCSFPGIDPATPSTARWSAPDAGKPESQLFMVPELQG